MASGLLVLIVEDDAMIGLLLTEILEEMGHTVCAVAATEEDAVADAARFAPGLLLVDLNLQEGSGVSAMARILNSGPRPFLFMSGAVDQIGWPDATVLSKPFAERDLVRAIESVVGSAAIMPSLPVGSPHIVPIH